MTITRHDGEFNDANHVTGQSDRVPDGGEQLLPIRCGCVPTFDNHCAVLVPIFRISALQVANMNRMPITCQVLSKTP